MGYCGYQEELLHHHKCPTTSYSITACSVFRCTGGFVIALIPNGKGVRMMLSTEYRESIERRFHAFCKDVLHNEACNYYRERKHRTQLWNSCGQKWRRWMMRNSKYNLVPYEVIERAITGDTAALLAVQERNKAYIGRLSGGNADMKERLNEKLLMDVMKFRLDYQPPSK